MILDREIQEQELTTLAVSIFFIYFILFFMIGVPRPPLPESEYYYLKSSLIVDRWTVVASDKQWATAAAPILLEQEYFVDEGLCDLHGRTAVVQFSHLVASNWYPIPQAALRDTLQFVPSDAK